jgi:hypothetical protein
MRGLSGGQPRARHGVSDDRLIRLPKTPIGFLEDTKSCHSRVMPGLCPGALSLASGLAVPVAPIVHAGASFCGSLPVPIALNTQAADRSRSRPNSDEVFRTPDGSAFAKRPTAKKR